MAILRRRSFREDEVYYITNIIIKLVIGKYCKYKRFTVVQEKNGFTDIN